MVEIDATAKGPKNAAKTTATLQNQVGKVLLTLASKFRKNREKNRLGRQANWGRFGRWVGAIWLSGAPNEFSRR